MNTNFIDDQYTLLYLGDAINNFYGGYIFLGVNSQGYIESTYFNNGEAYNGGAIYVSSEATLDVVKSTFSNCYAKKTGGAIYS